MYPDRFLGKSQYEDSQKSARALIKLQFHSIKSGELFNVISIDNNLVSRIPTNVWESY